MNERFFFDQDWNKPLSLIGSEYHHLAHVLRKNVGDEIDLVDGKGTIALARVAALEKDQATIEILKKWSEPAPAVSITMCLPLMRLEKLEWDIEKGTELGADRFFLFAADFSDKKDLSDHQIERLQLITIAALKQCKRSYLPEIKIFKSLKQAIPNIGTILFGDPESRKVFPEIKTSEVFFFTGPEKGFSKEEKKLLEEKGIGIKLHNNILRAETAPLAALAIFSQQRLME